VERKRGGIPSSALARPDRATIAHTQLLQFEELGLRPTTAVEGRVYREKLL
jgi:hypothetical protein